jgi:DNA invertase Pin-like site-specific DNA recombinase
MRAATYCRISSARQAADDRWSLSAQAENIDRLCEREGVTERQDFGDVRRWWKVPPQ